MINAERFDRLVKNNKANRRPWYYGLEGTWWWGSTEKDVRKKLIGNALKKYVTDECRKILKREPDSKELKYYVDEIYSGRLAKEKFFDVLRASKQYKKKIVMSLIKERPIILTIDEPRIRSPLQDIYYNYVSRPNGPLNIIIDRRVHYPVESIINDRLNGKKPDYIYWGFALGTSITKSANYINSNNIPVIVDIGDVECFVSGGKYSEHNLKNVHVKFIVAKWRKTDNYHALDKLNGFISKKDWLKYTKIIYAPLGINPETYEDRKLERDIDVSLICSINNKYKYHENRRKINKILRNIDDKINIKIGNVWGDEYITTLFRTKIFIVDGSGRCAMTQKYLEGAACGAMLLGDIPCTAKDILVDKISIVDTKDYSKIDKQIKYYLEHDNEREAIAKEGQRRIFDYYGLDKTTKEFEDIIMDDWKNKLSRR